MNPKTMYVKRAGHPDARVLINEADFDPDTETLWTEAESSAETPAAPESAAPAKTKAKRN